MEAELGFFCSIECERIADIRVRVSQREKESEKRRSGGFDLSLVTERGGEEEGMF